MCQLLFLASDHPLPEIPWNPEARGFHVRRATVDEDSVRAHLTKSHVYYVGSHEGCGCGFSVADLPIEDQFDQWNYDASLQNVASLREYLLENLGPFSAVEIYVAWNGNITRRPKRRQSLAIAAISETTFLADQPMLVHVKARGG